MLVAVFTIFGLRKYQAIPPSTWLEIARRQDSVGVNARRQWPPKRAREVASSSAGGADCRQHLIPQGITDPEDRPEQHARRIPRHTLPRPVRYQNTSKYHSHKQAGSQEISGARSQRVADALPSRIMPQLIPAMAIIAAGINGVRKDRAGRGDHARTCCANQ